MINKQLKEFVACARTQHYLKDEFFTAYKRKQLKDEF